MKVGGAGTSLHMAATGRGRKADTDGMRLFAQITSHSPNPIQRDTSDQLVDLDWPWKRRETVLLD